MAHRISFIVTELGADADPFGPRWKGAPNDLTADTGRPEGREGPRCCPGQPQATDVRDRAAASNRANAESFARNVAPVIWDIQASGIALRRAIPHALNAGGVATARAGQSTADQVGALFSGPNQKP